MTTKSKLGLPRFARNDDKSLRLKSLWRNEVKPSDVYRSRAERWVHERGFTKLQPKILSRLHYLRVSKIQHPIGHNHKQIDNVKN